MASVVITDVPVAKTPVFFLNLKDPRDVALLHPSKPSAFSIHSDPISPGVFVPPPTTGLKTRDGCWIASCVPPAPSYSRNGSVSSIASSSEGLSSAAKARASSASVASTIGGPTAGPAGGGGGGGLALRPDPTHSLLLSSLETSRNPFFHRACVYAADRDELFTTSDLLTPTSQSHLPIILISRVVLHRAVPGGGSGGHAASSSSGEAPPAAPSSSSGKAPGAWPGGPTSPGFPPGGGGQDQTSAMGAQPIRALEWMKLRPPRDMAMPADGLLFRRGILYCAQGGAGPANHAALALGSSGSSSSAAVQSPTVSAAAAARPTSPSSAAPGATAPPQPGMMGVGSPPSGLFYMPFNQPPRAVVTSYYGRDFNGVRSCCVCPRDGSVYFTDPHYAAEREFRPTPALPPHVYRYDPSTGNLRAVADGLGRPDGIAIGPAGDVLYVGDSEAARPADLGGATKAATIYAFDIVTRAGSPFLSNRRVFAYVLDGIPQAIRCDSKGNVYAACGDGVEVWSPGGDLLGVIAVPGGASSFCFGQEGEIFICSDQRLWRFNFGPPADPDAM